MESLIIIDMAVDNFFDTMGKRIRILRDDRKMNQTEMANRMGQFGQKVDPSYLSQIERGDKAPSLSVFKAIVQVLESTADYLLLLTDDPDTPGESVNETWSEVTRDIADIIDALPEAKQGAAGPRRQSAHCRHTQPPDRARHLRALRAADAPDAQRGRQHQRPAP